MLEKIKNLAKQGLFEDALVIADKMESVDRYFLYERAKIYLALSRFDNALEDIEKVLALKSDWLGAHSIKISVYLRRKDSECVLKALLDLSQASKRVDDKQSVCTGVINSILDSKLDRRYDVLSVFLEHYKLTNGADNFYNFYSGVVDSNTGNFASAAKKFDSLNGDTLMTLGRHCSGALSFTYGEELVHRTSEFYDKRFGIFFKLSNLECFQDFQSVTFAACDSGYFNLFSELFVRSFFSTNEHKVCHLHIVNPNDEAHSRASELMSGFKLLNVSYEYTCFKDNVYYACARFMHVESIIELYKSDVFVCDIDACFVGEVSFDNLLERNFDIAIKSDVTCKLNSFPWRKIAAGFIFARNSDAALDFFKKLKSYLFFSMISRKFENIWYLDQTAIFCILNYCDESGSKINYKLLLGRTSEVVIYPDAAKETKMEFVVNNVSKMRLPLELYSSTNSGS